MLVAILELLDCQSFSSSNYFLFLNLRSFVYFSAAMQQYVLVDTVASQTPSAQPARVPAALGPASQSWCTRRRLVHQSRHVANVHPDAVWKGFQSHLTEGEGWRSGRRSQAIRGREHLAAALPQLLEVVPVAPLQVLL